jgi:hypothetical protein
MWEVCCGSSAGNAGVASSWQLERVQLAVCIDFMLQVWQVRVDGPEVICSYQPFGGPIHRGQEQAHTIAEHQGPGSRW